MEPLLNTLTKRDRAGIVKDLIKETIKKNIGGKEEDDVLYLAYINSIIVCSFFFFYGL
jgi:hypothetical protein